MEKYRRRAEEANSVILELKARVKLAENSGRISDKAEALKAIVNCLNKTLSIYNLPSKALNEKVRTSLNTAFMAMDTEEKMHRCYAIAWNLLEELNRELTRLTTF